jgi:hypothetical protein
MDQDQVLPGMDQRKRIGRVERAVAADLATARRQDRLPPDTAGLAAAARSCARHLDQCEAARKPGMAPQLLAQLRDTYRDLGLVGATEGTTDELAAILGGIGTPTVPHAT